MGQAYMHFVPELATNPSTRRNHAPESIAHDSQTFGLEAIKTEDLGDAGPPSMWNVTLGHDDQRLAGRCEDKSDGS